MKVLKWIGLGFLVIILLLVAVYGYAHVASSATMNRQIETHVVDFPVPWPLTEEEIEAVRADGADGVDLDALARERALERGKHLASARYGCFECHGKDFSGGVMIDDGAIGQFFGPNLTRGEGSVVRDYTTADWDRIIRHGVTKAGNPTVMPSVDFLAMSDQELSDMIVYFDSLPPVDNVVPPVRYGPLGRILVAFGAVELTADMIDHHAPHPTLPPETAATVEFGEHLAQVCAGCHGLNFTGGPVPGAPPDWPPASDLTALQDWSLQDFDQVMRQGVMPDGSRVRSPMYEVQAMGANMTETEMEAMFMYFQSLSSR